MDVAEVRVGPEAVAEVRVGGVEVRVGPEAVVEVRVGARYMGWWG